MLLERISPGVIKSRLAQGILHLVLASTLWKYVAKSCSHPRKAVVQSKRGVKVKDLTNSTRTVPTLEETQRRIFHMVGLAAGDHGSLELTG